MTIAVGLFGVCVVKWFCTLAVLADMKMYTTRFVGGSLFCFHFVCLSPKEEDT